MNNNEPDITHQNSYKTEDIAIIIPTKDRPEEVKRLLQSIASLDCKVCRIIIVASGQDIQDVVMAFKPFLPESEKNIYGFFFFGTRYENLLR